MGWPPEREINILAGMPYGGRLDRTAHALRDALINERLLPVSPLNWD